MNLLTLALVVAQVTTGTGAFGQPKVTPTPLEVPATGAISIDGIVDNWVVARGKFLDVLVKHTNPNANLQTSFDAVTIDAGPAGPSGRSIHFLVKPDVTVGRHTLTVSDGNPTGGAGTRTIVVVDAGVTGPPPTPPFCTEVPAVLTVKTWPSFKNATATAPNFTFTSPAPLSSIVFYAVPVRAVAIDTRGCQADAKK